MRCTDVAVEPDLAAGEVDLELVDVDHRGRRRGVRDAPQRRADAREQLLGVERLGHVVVGAGVERGDLVLLSVARGEHDHGHVAERPHPPQHFDPVEVGEAEVEQHDVGSPIGDEHERFLAGRGTRRTSSDRARRLVRSARRSDGSSSITSTVVTRSCVVQLGTTNTNVAPPPGVSSHHTRPPCAVDERVHDRQAEPGAGGVGRASRRANSSKMRSRSSSGTPGP